MKRLEASLIDKERVLDLYETVEEDQREREKQKLKNKTRTQQQQQQQKIGNSVHSCIKITKSNQVKPKQN